MTILEISQGRLDPTGLPLDEARAVLCASDDEYLRQYPASRKYFSPGWRVVEARDGERAPWGCEWFVVDEHGNLRRHSAQYDSSG